MILISLGRSDQREFGKGAKRTCFRLVVPCTPRGLAAGILDVAWGHVWVLHPKAFLGLLQMITPVWPRICPFPQDVVSTCHRQGLCCAPEPGDRKSPHSAHPWDLQSGRGDNPTVVKIVQSEECYRGVPWYSGGVTGAGTGTSLG